MVRCVEPGDSRAVARRLAGFRVLNGLDPKAARLIARAGTWFCLPGGAELERLGAADRALFFVLSGTVSVHVDDGRGGLESVAHVPAGETLGEMSLLTDEPHSARLFAHRDTELFSLDRKAFERVAATYPELMRNLSILLIERLRRTTHRAAVRHGGRSVAFLAAYPSVDVNALASRVVTALWAMGIKATCLDSSDAGRPSEWYHGVEAAHDLVLYLASPHDPVWSRQAERQSDRVMLVINESDVDPEPAANSTFETRKPADRIVLADANPKRRTGPIGDGLRHLVRAGNTADVARLARFVAGRAIGLVLSGGGARGFAHLGVIRTLREAGIPIDAAGGTSMGAIVAAGLALEWSTDELTQRMREAFVDTNPISDLTVPTVAFFGGRKVRSLLDRAFGDHRIEETPLPFFCVTSDLTLGTDEAHRAGRLSDKLRASVAIPGILPPVVMEGRVHVDGGVMNNLPVDHMARLSAGPIIAIDVSGDTRLPAANGTAAPNILSILIRTGTVGNEWQRREARRAAALVLDPPIDEIGFRDWLAFDRAVAIGAEHAWERLNTDTDAFARLGMADWTRRAERRAAS
jgi:NTE family protein